MSPPAKKDLRKKFLAMRMALDASKRALWDRALVQHLGDLIKERGFSLVCLYVPFRGEPDLLSLAGLNLGAIWALPVIGEGPLVDMSFVVYKPGMSMKPNRLGIPEPEVRMPVSWGEERSRTLIVVPALAVDQAGVRLGYGGGYYDSFMARFLPGSKPNLVAALPLDFVVPALPREDHDLVLDLIVTQDGVLPPVRA